MKQKYNRKKQVFASFLLPILLITIGISVIIKFNTVKKLTIINQNTGEVYYTNTVKESDTLIFNWIHSLEKIPWDEEYLILKNNNLLLNKITLIGFGAGIPHNRGQVTTIDDGVIVMSQIDEEFNEINWIHSQTALSSIRLNDKIIIEGKDLIHHEELRLKIEKGLGLCQK